jgi:hypothetical protein
MGSQRDRKPSGSLKMYAPAARHRTYKQRENLLQANYINALAVSVLPFFEPAKGTLGGISPPVGGFFITLGELFKSGR